MVRARGLSSIVVVILLLLIGIVLTVATYAWFQTTQAKVFGGIESQQQSGLRKAGSQMTVLSVDPSSNPVVISVKNTGKYDLINITVYVNSSLFASFTAPAVLTPGAIGNINLSGLASSYYDVMITTPYTQAAVTFVKP